MRRYGNLKRQDKQTAIAIFWVLFFAGVIIGTTNLLAPIHEFGHLLIASRQGDNMKLTGWASTTGEPSANQVLGGYAIEFYFMVGVGLLLSLFGNDKRGWFWLGAPLLGHSVSSWLTVYRSYDMNSYLEKVLELEDLTPDQIAYVSRFAVRRWTTICIVGMLLVTAFIVYWHRQRK